MGELTIIQENLMTLDYDPAEISGFLKLHKAKGLENYLLTDIYLAQRHSLGENTNIVIINSGVDYTHPDLKQRFGRFKGINYIWYRDENEGDTTSPMDLHGHGTSIAGIIAGEKTGIAPRSKLYALKVVDKYGKMNLADFLSGLRTNLNSDKMKADIVNISLSIEEDSKDVEETINSLTEQGIVVIASVANDKNKKAYPAAFKNVISVGSTNEKGEVSKFSYDQEVDLFAPGERQFTTAINEGNIHTYKGHCGTSIATAHVTGITALLISHMKKQNIDYNPQYIKELLITNSDENKLINAEKIFKDIMHTS